MVENYVPPKPIDSSNIGSTVIWTAKEGFKVGAEAPKQPRISFDEMIEAGLLHPIPRRYFRLEINDTGVNFIDSS